MARKRILLRKNKPVEGVTGFVEKLFENRRLSLSLGITVCIIFILLVSGYFYLTYYDERIVESFTKGNMLYEATLLTEGKAKTLKDYEESVVLFKKVVSSYPKNKVESLAYLSLGDIYYQTGEYSKALESYEHIIKGNYDVNLKSLALYSTGKILESIEKYDEAIKRFEEINKTGNFLKSLVLVDLGRLYERNNNPSEAINRFEEFLMLNPDSILVDEIRYRVSILEAGNQPPQEPRP